MIEIELDGVDLTDSLEVIGEKFNLDPSLVTSRAMAETFPRSKIVRYMRIN